MNELGNLKSKLEDGLDSVLGMTKYTMNNSNKSIEECFPVEIFRIVTINGKDYQLNIRCQMRKL